MKRRVVQTIYRTGNGQWLDGSIYYEQKHSRRRNVKHRPSSEAQQRLNEDNARRAAARILQDNFRDGVDFIVHPTYSDTFLPGDSSRVRKDVRNFFNRVKRLYKRLGIKCEFKYFGSAVGDNKIRKHMHYVMTGSKYPNLADEIRALWPYGTCNVDRVQPDGQDGLMGIASYICDNYRKAKDVGETIFSKRWCCSRNLIRPEPSERRGALPISFLPKLASAVPTERFEMIERLFPGYKAIEVDVAELKDAPEDRKHRIYGNYYVYLRMRKYTSQEIKERKRKIPTQFCDQ